MPTASSTIDVPPRILTYLKAHEILTLATASPSGLPHAATMVYVADGVALYFATKPGTTTARHIDSNPTVSFTIDEYYTDWNKTKGIQGRGQCGVLGDAGEIRHAVTLFHHKFPQISDAGTAEMAVYRITPAEIHFIDNEAGGGHQVGRALGIEYRRGMVYNVFHDLPQQEVDTIAAKLDPMQVKAGEIIVRQGAPADKFFIIVDGEVEIVRQDEETGVSQSVATLKRGQFFGEIAIMRDMPRTATVRARAATTLLTMDRAAFRSLVAQSLATSHEFDTVVRQRLSDLAARTAH